MDLEMPGISRNSSTQNRCLPIHLPLDSSTSTSKEIILVRREKISNNKSIPKIITGDLCHLIGVTVATTAEGEHLVRKHLVVARDTTATAAAELKDQVSSSSNRRKRVTYLLDCNNNNHSSNSNSNSNLRQAVVVAVDKDPARNNNRINNSNNNEGGAVVAITTSPVVVEDIPTATIENPETGESDTSARVTIKTPVTTIAGITTTCPMIQAGTGILIGAEETAVIGIAVVAEGMITGRGAATPEDSIPTETSNSLTGEKWEDNPPDPLRSRRCRQDFRESRITATNTRMRTTATETTGVTEKGSKSTKIIQIPSVGESITIRRLIPTVEVDTPSAEPPTTPTN